MSIGESIHNYYENMVNDALAERLGDSDHDADYLADVACVALNHLPPRYFRHEIDMAFYLSPTELNEMREKVQKAVDEAVAYVEKSHREMEAESFPQVEGGIQNDPFSLKIPGPTDTDE